MATEANVKIRNLPLLADVQNTSGNFIPVALNPEEGRGLGVLNPAETRKATFAQIVSGGAVRADFSEALMVSGAHVSTGADADNIITLPPHEYGERFTDTIVVGDRARNFETAITFRIGEVQMLRIDENGVSVGEDSMYFMNSQASDQRLKDDIVPIEEPISLLNEINGVNFIWNENAPKHKQGQKDIGLIAQEVEKVIPSAVQKNPEGNLTVAYDKLVPLLVETVKKQQEQIDDLNLRLNKLENR
jgi:hypothetical protein